MFMLNIRRNTTPWLQVRLQLYNFTMWTMRENSICWADSAKMLLLKQIQLHPVALNNHERDRNKKMIAWQKIYISLIKSGMPTN